MVLSSNMLHLWQGTGGTELGGAAVPCNFDSKKFVEL